jgi:hypothetical protein
VISSKLQPLYLQGKSTWYPLVRKLVGGHLSRYESGGEENRIAAPVFQFVAYTIYRLSYIKKLRL